MKENKTLKLDLGCASYQFFIGNVWRTTTPMIPRYFCALFHVVLLELDVLLQFISVTHTEIAAGAVDVHLVCNYLIRQAEGSHHGAKSVW